jgi:ribose transport system permease protein
MLAFTEVGLLAIGLTFVIANGDIDLSVGSILALSGATAAFLMKQLGYEPLTAVFLALLAGAAAGFVNAFVTVNLRLPAFVATLGMFYMARGIGAWLVAGRQLSGFPEEFNLVGRNSSRHCVIWDRTGARLPLFLHRRRAQRTVDFHGPPRPSSPASSSATRFGASRFTLPAATPAPPNMPASTPTASVSSAWSSPASAPPSPGIIYIAFLRSFNPSAGQLRELDAIAAVIIGGGSIFGGHGTVLGSLAGAAVIALMRALLSLQIIRGDGSSFVMPQHWVNVVHRPHPDHRVLGDIWARRLNFRGMILRLGMGRRTEPAHA